MPYVGRVSVPEGPSITWNPSDKAATYTLSNSDLTATNTGGTTLTIVRSAAGRSSGRKYLEFVSDSSFGSAAGAVGVCVSSASLTDWLGLASGSWGYWTSGNRWNNNTSIGGYGAWDSLNPGYLAIAVDFDNLKMWFRREGVWQGGGDPAAGTSPAYTFSAGLTLYPTYDGDRTNDYCTLVSTYATFLHSVPSGFTSWATP